MKYSYSQLFRTLAGGLAALLLALWLLPHGWRAWQPPPPQPPELQDVLETLLAPNPTAGAAYPEAVNRPLFSINRRPVPTDPVASAAPPPTPIQQARLLGIVDGPGVNVIMLEYEGQPRTVRLGEDVGGWRLAGINERSANFERGGQRHELTLPLIGSEPPAPAGNPAAPGQPTGQPARAPAPQPARPPVPQPAAPVPQPARAPVPQPAAPVPQPGYVPVPQPAVVPAPRPAPRTEASPQPQPQQQPQPAGAASSAPSRGSFGGRRLAPRPPAEPSSR